MIPTPEPLDDKTDAQLVAKGGAHRIRRALREGEIDPELEPLAKDLSKLLDHVANADPEELEDEEDES